MKRPKDLSRKGLSRREFTKESAMAILSGVVVTISGCSDGDSTPAAPTQTVPPSAPSTGSNDDILGVVSANHGHIARVTQAQITAGNDVLLDINGSADHSHTVVLIANDLMQIGNGVRVSRSSSQFTEDPLYPEVGSHSHQVTFN